MMLGTQTQHITRPVMWQEHLGEATYMYLDFEQNNTGTTQDSWMIKVPGHGGSTAGDRVAVSLPANALHVFDANGIALARSISDDTLKASSHLH
jgi:multiple sugar transport system ATP-binding protein